MLNPMLAALRRDLLELIGPRLPLGLAIPVALLAAAALAVPALLVAFAPHPAALPGQVAIATRVVPRTELPKVDPVRLQAVSEDDARKINASIPYSTEPNPPAAPFQLYGSLESQARAIDCLAAAVYYEAGDDAIGQRAVAQVILNRMRHPAFPKTVCGVVFQGSERKTGCQFTFTCDGAMIRRKPSAAAWERARALARMALNGSVYAPVGHATHYHTDWVFPYWSSSLEKITEVHTHLFFRWTGFWGTPGAYTLSYAGAEPNIAKMAALSGAHGGDPGALLAELAGAEPGAAGVAVAPEAIPASQVPAAVAGEDNAFLVTLPRGMNADSFASLAIRTCGEKPYCKFMAWSDPSKTPARLPLSSAQVAAMSFSYLRDQNRGFAKALWNCGQYPRPSPVQCMRAQPLAAPAPAPSPTLTPGALVIPPAGPTPLSGIRRRDGALQPAPRASPSPAPAP
ncbi:cell wall hydrolase [Sphingomonas canadensis]|uniref:Cell wall hydrolase n=1 Tax=Sphingomonas canadensis TaxID=1219257 RepID=A0ABW3H9W6_9SPHN|nr:cell wall hydrolase [Sphingomonas canadensis]MCW3837922.1 cell wall hydrolase [Sphingomonas canadensis]